MIRSALLATAFLATALALAAMSPAWADSQTVDGGALVANLNLDSSVSIETDTHLHGKIRVSGDDLSCLQLNPGAVVGTSDCGSALGHLRIDIPPNASVTLTMDGDGEVTLADITGPLVANVNGSGNLNAGRVGPLVLTVHGSGDVVVDSATGSAVMNSDSSGTMRLRHFDGVLRTIQSGSGDLVVGTINADSADIIMHSSGDAAIGKGHIEQFHAELSGSGDLVVAATATNADLLARGGGDIKVAHVTGQLHKSASSGSSVSVMNSDLAQYGIGKIAELAADADEDSSRHGTTINIKSHHGGPHIVAGIAVLIIIYVVWRAIQRNGGLPNLPRAFRMPNTPPAPTHPGVLAIRDTISRLEGRLARVEGYVTTREFDLQRKFRDLDKT